MAIIYVQLEPLEQRYSNMMNNALAPYVDHVISPKYDRTTIKNGQFLDITATIEYKSLQLAMIARLFDQGRISDGDVFLFADLFTPGIESVKYMAELLGIDVKIAAFNYAGRADAMDFIQHLGGWADYAEQGYHSVCDYIFVGSQFHKMNIVNHFDVDPTNIYVTGYVWDSNYLNDLWKPNTAQVHPKRLIWPHRPCFEKGVEEFLKFCKDYGHMFRIFVTTCGNKDERFAMRLPRNVAYLHNLTKQEYYEALDGSEFYLSTAHQETFGYTLQEAIFYGCKIAVPNRACYPEMVDSSAIYKYNDDIAETLMTSKVQKNKYTNNAPQIIKILSNDNL